MLQFARLCFLLFLTLAWLGSAVAAVAQEQIPITNGGLSVQTTDTNDHSTPQSPATLFKVTSSPERPSAEGPTSPSLPWLITSPYTTQEHLNNLSTLPIPSKLLTLALTHLSAEDTTYATTPYQDALNWPTVFAQLKSLSATHNHTWLTTTFYVVEFRSRLKRDIDRDLLFKLDRESHREATASGGLLKYWFGKTSDDEQGRNLATCLWREKQDAVAGGKGPWHKRARGVIPRMYESIEVKGLKLTVEDNVEDWKFEPWVDEA